MNYLKILIDTFGCGLEAIIVYTLFSSVIGKGIFKAKVSFFVYLLFFVISSFAATIVKPTIILSGIMFALTFAFSFLHRGNIFVKIFSVIFVVALGILTEILTGVIFVAITNQNAEIVSTNLFYYVQGVLISKAMQLTIVKMIQYKKLPINLNISNKILIPMLLSPATTIFIIFLLSEYAYSLVGIRAALLVAITTILMIVSNMLSFYLFEKQLKQDQESQKNTLIQQQLQYQTEYYKELADKYKLSNKTIHDTKNQLFAISIALENNDMTKAKSKIDELCSNVAGGAKTIKTGNDALDALLNTKYNGNRERNIVFSYDIVIPPKNQIDDIDLCIIIGNALDNAIEACAKIGSEEPKIITLRMTQINNHLAIEMINPAPEGINQSGGKLLSSKKDRELHGFGMQSIEEIVNKYNGNVGFSQKDGLFVLKIYMENAVAVEIVETVENSAF